MERQNFVEKYWHVLLLAFFYAVGILGHSLQNFLPLMKDLTPYTLLVTSAFVVYMTKDDWNKKVIIWALATFIFTYSLEVAGVATGVIFGRYSYGDTLGLKLLDVPLIIGINWVIIIYAVVSILTKATDNLFAFIFLTGAAVVAFDFVMEPVAIHLNYWRWEGDKVPFQNYLAWFLVAVISATGYFFLKQRPEKELPIWYVLIQFLFFVFLNFILGANGN